MSQQLTNETIKKEHNAASGNGNCNSAEKPTSETDANRIAPFVLPDNVVAPYSFEEFLKQRVEKVLKENEDLLKEYNDHKQNIVDSFKKKLNTTNYSVFVSLGMFDHSTVNGGKEAWKSKMSHPKVMAAKEFLREIAKAGYYYKCRYSAFNTSTDKIVEIRLK